MKYLTVPALDHLSNTLSSTPSAELRVHARFEAYSVKPIGKERKMFKEMEEAYVSGQEEMEELSFSPEMKEAGLSSCFGRLDEKESRKVHFLLVSTLNAAFPDHDFAGLRPDHFTREISAAHVLEELSGMLLLGPSTAPLLGCIPQSSPLSRSPASNSPQQQVVNASNPDLYRTLSEVVPLEECEVYSWFPEREYDPHVEPEDGETSEDGFELGGAQESEVLGDIDMEETEASWGTAGMELDDVAFEGVPASAPMARQLSTSGKERIDSSLSLSSKREEPRGGGLLWSANYFFYSKRQKRVLFLTSWCRKRAGQTSLPFEDSFPAPISASFSHPSMLQASSSSLKSYKPRSNPMRNYTKRRSKPNLKAAATGSISNTIPIRGMELSTPVKPRLAVSAPSAISPMVTVTSASVARMTAGGLKPRHPGQRGTGRDSATPVPIGRGGGAMELEVGSRVRKDRSESSTPGPVVMRTGPEAKGGAGLGEVKGKRSKVGGASAG